MATQHTVQPGDHIARFAKKHGFGDPKIIWDDGANAELRSRRKNPNVLLPGDVVHIPDLAQKVVPVSTGRTHTFRVSVPKLWLRLVVLDYDREPLPGVECRLTVDGEAEDLTTGGDGLLEAAIPRDARGGTLAIASLKVETAFRIGHLDPVDELSGYRGRLNNLGYFAGESDDPPAPSPRRI